MNTNLTAGGIFKFEQIRDGVVIDTWETTNLVVDEGLTYLLGNSFDGTTPTITTWYLGLFSNNRAPVNTDTAATFPGDSGETTTPYSEATRPEWIEGAVTSNPVAIGNTASVGVFTFVDPTTNVYGAFMVSTNTKGGTLGTLAAASQFSSMRTMLASDVLNVTYTLSATST